MGSNPAAPIDDKPCLLVFLEDWQVFQSCMRYDTKFLAQNHSKTSLQIIIGIGTAPIYHPSFKSPALIPDPNKYSMALSSKSLENKYIKVILQKVYYYCYYS
ncbi:hypothetical protein LC607_01985 [Nostoc sp. CHAB 5824]|nr:hypothetical protein [Nostoc sp. CHAB 5824]